MKVCGMLVEGYIASTPITRSSSRNCRSSSRNCNYSPQPSHNLHITSTPHHLLLPQPSRIRLKLPQTLHPSTSTVNPQPLTVNPHHLLLPQPSRIRLELLRCLLPTRLVRTHARAVARLLPARPALFLHSQLLWLLRTSSLQAVPSFCTHLHLLPARPALFLHSQLLLLRSPPPPLLLLLLGRRRLQLQLPRPPPPLFLLFVGSRCNKGYEGVRGLRGWDSGADRGNERQACWN